MTEHHTAAWAEIHTADVEYNLQAIRSMVGAETKVCGILKADAYGHGMVGMKKYLSENRLVDLFAVGKMTELIRQSAEAPEGNLSVLLLGAVDCWEIEDCLVHQGVSPETAVFSVYSLNQFQELVQLAQRLSMRIRVHLRMDGWGSGMGLSYGEYLEHQDIFFSQTCLDVCGLYSHLYTSYSGDWAAIRMELERFDAFVKQVRPEYRQRLTVHILNSSLVFAFPEFAYDMVRVGTALYGLPCGTDKELHPVMRICARIFDVREIDVTIPLSYKPATSSNGRRKIARIMLGYWDNPLLLTQEDIHIWIKGRLFQLADDICMDNLCIDISGTEDIHAGDLAVLLGEEGVTVNDVCQRNGIQYVHSERMCMTAGRLEKVYI